MLLTYKFRLKDGTKRKELKALAGNVNFVWNFSNAIIRRRWQESRFYTSRNDLNVLTKGSSKLLEINSQTVQAVAYECLLRVQKAKKSVRFRTGKKNLGWIPFNGQTVRFHGGYIDYNGYKFRPFDSDVGVDPGMKTIMTSSVGLAYSRDSITRQFAEKLAKAQRHRKKRQIKKINAKIKNSRQDWNHKKSFELARQYQTIFFGAACSGRLAKTRMAKGIYDAGWHQIKIFLSYKSLRRGGRMLEINERNSTVTCSACLQKTGPSGLSGLGIREWSCPCGAVHDRDVNAAKNILRLGRETLSLGQKA